MKQTAVEWLVENMQRLNQHESPEEWNKLFEQAKEMEKEQHQETWDVAHQAGRFEGKGIAEKDWQTFETHWEETFKSE
jgi:hypothetical protein